MSDVEDLFKAGLLLLIGAAILSGTIISANVAESLTGLGVFLIIMAIIVAIISALVPFLRKIL